MSMTRTIARKQAIIHLLHAAPNGPIQSSRQERDPATGIWVEVTRNLAIACAPDAPHAKSMTDVASVVTCPLCQATEVYRRLMDLQNQSPDDVARRAMEQGFSRSDESGAGSESPVEVLPPSALPGAKQIPD